MSAFNLKVEEKVLLKGDRASLGKKNIVEKTVFSYYGIDNFNPFVLSAIPDQHIPYRSTFDIDISSTFDDADIDRGDVITVTAVSSDYSKVGASIINNTLKLYANNVGQATITLTAIDLLGLSITDSLIVEVFAIVWISTTRSIPPNPGSGRFDAWEIDSKTGDILSTFNATFIPSGNPLASMPSIEYDRSDATLWFNDNQDSKPNGTGGQRLFHVELDGTLISEVVTTGLGMNNPDGIAIDDTFSDSLWFVSNADDKVFRTNEAVTELISSFSFGTSLAGLAITPFNATLWIVDADPAVRTIYNVNRNGVTLSSFPFSDFTTDLIIRCIGFERSSETLWIVSQDGSVDKINSLHNIDVKGNSLSTPIILNNNILGLETSGAGTFGLGISS